MAALNSDIKIADNENADKIDIKVADSDADKTNKNDKMCGEFQISEVSYPSVNVSDNFLDNNGT